MATHPDGEDNVRQLFTETDQQDLEQVLGDEAEQAPYHTILEVWREVLAPAADMKTQKVTPNWAARIVAQFPQVKIQEMDDYRDLYYDKVEVLAQIVRDEIETDDECLNYTEPAEDAEQNAGHYREILYKWQEQILVWEMDWLCTDADAHLELAAISEVHKMFFSQTGITAYLDNINFQFTDADQASIRDRLEALKVAE